MVPDKKVSNNNTLDQPGTTTSLKIYSTTIKMAAKIESMESNTPNFTDKRNGLSEKVKIVSIANLNLF